MSLAPPPTYDFTPNTGLKPYLELPHLLSLTWLAYPILSLIFVAFRLQLSSASAQTGIESAKSNLLASCKAAEQAATSAASMPRFMAQATNEQFASAVNGSLNAARAALVLSLTVMEGIINFIIDLYRSTFLCFLELVIRGGLSILIGAVEELNKLVKTVAGGLQGSIGDSINNANSVIRGAVDAINKVNPFSDIQVPQIAVPDLSSLSNIQLPEEFQQALKQLNDTLPSFDDLKEKVQDVISTPFELVKKEINDTFANITLTPEGMPVPQQRQLSFCNDLDTSVVDDLGRDLLRITKIGIIVLVLLALILIALNCLLEWYKWRCMKQHLEYTRQAWSTDPTIAHVHPGLGVPQVTLSDHNLLMLQSNMSHPLITRILNVASTKLRLSSSQHTKLSWFLNYIFHPSALACLLVGVIGILTIQIQLFALGPLREQYTDRVASQTADFSNTIATSINASMYDQSAAYANDINARVDAMQASINDGVFGWVNVTTVTLNTTINEFYDEVQNAVTLVFNNTILNQPAQEFIRCLIGTKVVAIENALTFLHDNLKVDVPRMNQTVLVLSQATVDEATRPVALAAVGGGEGGDDTGFVGKLIKNYTDSLEKERIMFAIFIFLWFFVILMGICVLLWHSFGSSAVEARKRRKWEDNKNAFVEPFQSGQPARAEKTPALHQPSFSPMPSPKATSFNPFKRSGSPTGIPFDQESLRQPQSERSWDQLIKDDRTRKISGPMKLFALGRKDVAQDKEQPTLPAAESSAQSSDSAGNRATLWFGKILSKKPAEETLSSPRPPLQITVHPPTERTDSPGSRWSTSPDGPRSSAWKLASPPFKKQGLPSQPKLTIVPPPAGVPSDVTTEYENSALPEPTPQFAPPLHHGFDNSPRAATKQRIQPSALYFAPDSPTTSKTRFNPPPPPRHPNRLSVAPVADASSTPVTRFLTSTHARKLSSLQTDVNPFMTPFDDEHQVTIDRTTTRKSMSTNPFEV